jgi:hypothetical protein
MTIKAASSILQGPSLTQASQSLQKNVAFFCDSCGQKSLIMLHIFLKNAMKYRGIFMQFYVVKLRELAKNAGTCEKIRENCGLKKRGKK